MSGRAPVCWSMHMTAAEPDVHGRSTVALQSLEARLSRIVPARIASCSYSTYELMERMGYDLGRAEVIPNGFDVDVFRPDPAARAAIRAELGIDAGDPVVAHAARYHPMKDHRNLLEAAERVARRAARGPLPALRRRRGRRPTRSSRRSPSDSAARCDLLGRPRRRDADLPGRRRGDPLLVGGRGDAARDRRGDGVRPAGRLDRLRATRPSWSATPGASCPSAAPTCSRRGSSSSSPCPPPSAPAARRAGAGADRRSLLAERHGRAATSGSGPS